jgi:hypothetical protein
MARVTLALAAVASLAVASPPAARAAGGCEVPKDATVRARTAQAVVYRNEDHVSACLERTGRTVFLKHVDGPGQGSAERVGAIALAGPLLAYADASNTAYGQSARIRLLDLRRPSRRVDAGEAGDFGEPVAVPRLLLTRDGWLAYSSPDGKVWVRDALGLRKVADSPSLDARSLRLDGEEVTWTDGGEAGTAHIQGSGACGVRWHDRVKRHGGGFVLYESRGPGSKARVFACRRRTGERQLLQLEDRSIAQLDVAHNYHLAGHYAGWSEDYEDRYGNQRAYVNVWDLDAGKMADTVRIAADGPDSPYDFTVFSIVLSAAGNVAWMLGDQPGYAGQPGYGANLVVGAHDACGTRKLDDRSDIHVRSLRLRGEVVMWRSGGVLHQAHFRRC